MPGFLARVGVEWRWFAVQGAFGKWGPSFDTSPTALPPFRTYSARLNATDFGIEAGPVLRISTWLELRLGGGAHVLWGSANLSYPGRPSLDSPFTRVVPTFSGAFQGTFFPMSNGSRFRAGVEARSYLSSAVTFPELSRAVSIAEFYLGGYVGFEFALSSRSVTTATAAA